ncbi:MAG: pyrimidine/purine nucleoside phosphorylase [Proteobacteria bacterium]|nr:pyrimidine/purine nucleoside phosphorylase [Pseudomonadota bacterium]
MSQFENVTVLKQANVYFDGKCISHTVQFSDGSKKSVGVILPATLTFNTGVAEIMEGVAGACRMRLKGATLKTGLAFVDIKQAHLAGLPYAAT